jgi:hypothetical protein
MVSKDKADQRGKSHLPLLPGYRQNLTH